MNPVFCDQIFSVTKTIHFEVFAVMFVSLSETPRWPLHALKLNISNTHSPKLFNEIFLCFKIGPDV